MAQRFAAALLGILLLSTAAESRFLSHAAATPTLLRPPARSLSASAIRVGSIFHDDRANANDSNVTGPSVVLHYGSQLFNVSSGESFSSGRPRELRAPIFWSPNWEQWYNGHNVGSSGYGKRWAPTWILATTPGVKHFAVCTPPRNGCSRWKRLLRRIQGYKDYLTRHPHHNNGLSSSGELTISEQTHFWGTPENFKIMLVRNPLERLLSAYLSQKEGWFLPATFAVFVTQLLSGGVRATKHTPWFNPDLWTPQTELCDSPSHFHYDFVAKVEDRDLWMPKLENFLNIHPYTDGGWGDNNEPFQSPDNSYFPESKTTTSTQVLTLRQHYTPQLFRGVCRYFREDIRILGYHDDVLGLWQDLFQDAHGDLGAY